MAGRHVSCRGHVTSGSSGFALAPWELCGACYCSSWLMLSV
jgi:hypothetical protein